MKNIEDMSEDELLAERERLTAEIARYEEAELNRRDRQLGIPVEKPASTNRTPEPVKYTKQQLATGNFDIDLLTSGRAIVVD